VSELAQSTHGRFGPGPRLADISGLVGLIRGSAGLAATVLFCMVIALLIAAAWVLSWPAGADRRLPPLDRYVLAGVVVITAMMFAPSEWYEHYAAFDGPFVVLAVALPVARLAAAPRTAAVPRLASVPGAAAASRAAASRAAASRAAGALAAGALAAAAVVVVIAVLALASVSVSARQSPVRSLAAASGVIPPGACVVTDTASATIAVDRFIAASPGCPQLVDSVGTLIATTRGQDMTGRRADLAADTNAWQQAFSRARYVWLIGNGGNTGARIAWTRSLFNYFVHHFRLLQFASVFRGKGDVPRGGLYVRVWLRQVHNGHDHMGIAYPAEPGGVP